MSRVPFFFGAKEMIPLYRLARLPHSQGLRKSSKIFEQAERTFLLKGEISEKELLSLSNILDYWISRTSEPLAKALTSVREVLKQGEIQEADIIRRSLNTVHHLLRRETGQYPADWDFCTSGNLDPQKRQVFSGMEVYLEDIRSPFNVGAMFRTAESFGVEKLYLSPFCADPEHPRSHRTAMGCVSILPWSRLAENPWDLHPTDSNPRDSESFFPEKKLFALETGGIKLEDFPFPAQGIMIVGSEELGVSPKALAAADASLGRLSIPIYGAKASLNVSVAFGIAMQAWAVSLVDKTVEKTYN